MADNRLDPDINLLGYWGFDEALETDDAVDGATNFAPANLTVTAAVSVQYGRIGAAREFNGSSSFASVTSARLRLIGEASFLAWGQLNLYNGGGSTLRTILSCGGPTTGDNLLYFVGVDSTGRLVYKHTASGGSVVVRTASSTIRTAQFYNISVRRVASGLNQVIEFFVDNVQIPVADVTVGGITSAFPVPPPVANSSAIFSVGRSQKEADSAFWQGLLDEVSVHDVARSFQPYLKGSYYRVALRNTTSRLSSTNSIISIASSDMVAGIRWWCYERDKDLYVVRESPFGFFGSETRLTTPGGGASTLAGMPELLYDLATDTLYVFFVAGNSIYKLTAQSTDAPATINMPFTADTGGIIKSVDNAEGGGFGNGGGQREVIPADITYVNRSPVKVFGEDLPSFDLGNGGGQRSVIQFNPVPVPSADFMTRSSSFGVVVGPLHSKVGGYRILRVAGGANQVLGTASLTSEGHFYFLAFPTPPLYGDVFYAESLYRNGEPTGIFSNAIIYRMFEPILERSVYVIGREGDGTDTMSCGNGGGQRQLIPEDIIYVNRTPVKISGEDSPAFDLANGGGMSGILTASGSNRPSGVAILVNL